MANEAIIIEKYGYPPGEPRQVTVAAGTSISSGTLMVLSDPQTGTASSGVNQFFLGILAHDKDGSDGSTKATLFTNVLADLVSVSAGSLPTAGYPVELSGANLIRQSTQIALSGAAFISGAAFMVGIAQETASASERIAVRIRT